MDQPDLPDRELLTPLRGRRGYVHSTDLMAALETEACRLLGRGSWVRQLIMRRQASSVVVASFTPPPESFGTFRLQGAAADLKGWLVESGRPILSRQPFEEHLVTSRIVFAGELAMLPDPVAGFTRFEQVLLLTKALVDRKVPGPWVLSQVDLDGPLPQGGPLESRVTRLIDSRFSYAVANQNGLRLGTVRAIMADTPLTQ